MINRNDVKIDYLGLAEMKNEYIEVGFDYHDTDSFNQLNTHKKENVCLFHVNMRRLRKNLEKLSMILADLQVPPQIIAPSETKIYKKQGVNVSTSLVGYNFLHCDSDTLAGGVGIYINNSLSYQLRNDIPTTFGNSESLWIEVCICHKKCVIGVIYRHPNNDIHTFTHNLSETLHYLSNSKLPFLICGDININLLQQDTMLSVRNYVNTYNSYNCLDLITKPTRITTTSSTLIDHIYTLICQPVS